MTLLINSRKFARGREASPVSHYHSMLVAVPRRFPAGCDPAWPDRFAIQGDVRSKHSRGPLLRKTPSGLSSATLSAGIACRDHRDSAAMGREPAQDVVLGAKVVCHHLHAHDSSVRFLSLMSFISNLDLESLGCSSNEHFTENSKFTLCCLFYIISIIEKFHGVISKNHESSAI